MDEVITKDVEVQYDHSEEVYIIITYAVITVCSLIQMNEVLTKDAEDYFAPLIGIHNIYACKN